MSTDLYVAASAQVAHAAAMETIANNIANINTAGYRAAGVKFEAALSKIGGEPVAFASPGEIYISRDAGPISYTGNRLDVAVDGDGWFALQSPNGTVYTRDGRMHLTDLGELQTVAGYPVLDSAAGRSRSIRPPGRSTIGDNGMISQGGKQVGAIGLFLIPPEAKLTRYDNSAVIPEQAGGTGRGLHHQQHARATSKARTSIRSWK